MIQAAMTPLIAARPHVRAALLAWALTPLLGACGLLFEPDSTASHITAVGPPAQPVRLHTEEEGAGEPVIMLHGYGASAYSWRRLRPALARTHTVIAIDLKGFGRSEKPFDDTYSALDQAKLILDFIEKRDLRNITLIGHSFGGSVALALAIKLNQVRPTRLKKLVLLDAAAYEQGLPPALHVLRVPVLAQVASTAIPPEVKSAAALAFAYQDPSKVGSADVAAYARPMYEPGNQHALIETARKIIPKYANILTYQYRTLRQPALLIWCRNDRIVPLAIGQRLARELPRARLEIIESCGHVPQEEEPELTALAISRFLKRSL